MKKFLSLILLTALICFSITSCNLSGLNLDFGDRDSKEQTVIMYGVVTHLEDLNNTCVFFASSGHMTMPRLKSGEAVPEYEVGDLVKVVFTTDQYGIPVMESFPGQFGIEADEVEIKKADVSLFYEENIYFYSDRIPDDSDLTVGDSIILFSTVEGQRKELAEGELTDAGEELFTVELDSYGDLESILKYRFEHGLFIEKK